MLTVAIVDDEDDMAFFNAMTLDQEGYRTEVYKSGRDFLDRYTPKPGCVLLEEMMPNLGALDVMREMRERQWTVPVLTNSSLGPLPPSPEVYPHWVGHLEQPFTLEVLLETVRSAVMAVGRK
jgi:FixJ family two-component response regulator